MHISSNRSKKNHTPIITREAIEQQNDASEIKFDGKRIKFTCPSCQNRVAVSIEGSGRVMQCRSCHQYLRAPSLNSGAEQALINKEEYQSGKKEEQKEDQQKASTRKKKLLFFLIGLCICGLIAALAYLKIQSHLAAKLAEKNNPQLNSAQQGASAIRNFLKAATYEDYQNNPAIDPQDLPRLKQALTWKIPLQEKNSQLSFEKSVKLSNGIHLFYTLKTEGSEDPLGINYIQYLNQDKEPTKVGKIAVTNWLDSRHHLLERFLSGNFSKKGIFQAYLNRRHHQSDELIPELPKNSGQLVGVNIHGLSSATPVRAFTSQAVLNKTNLPIEWNKTNLFEISLVRQQTKAGELLFYIKELKRPATSVATDHNN